MDRFRLLELVAQLGGEFRRRGMPEHSRKLRVYYLALKRGLDSRNTLEVHWDEAQVIEWFRMFQLPPYHDDYPVQTSSECPRCTRDAGNVFTVSVFPGGAKAECRRCGRRWLELRKP